jgi:hypothetical protein
VDYWEVLNEPDFEHDHAAAYSFRHDAMVTAIRVAPEMML